jgi:hypothetical protein
MKALIAVIGLILLAGCNANWNSIYRTHDFNINRDEEKIPQKSVFIDIHQRAIISGNYTICAEPSPDAMQAYAAELAASGALDEKAKAELAAAVQTTAAYIGVRSKNIQLFRDGYYRLCEARLNDTLDDAQYNFFLSRLQRYSVALAAIEELNRSNITPAVILSTSGEASIAGLGAKEKELTEIKKELTIAKDSAAKTSSEEDKAKVVELTKKADTLQNEIDSGKRVAVTGKGSGEIASLTSTTSTSNTDIAKATQEIITAALGYNDLPYMCLERLHEYSKYNMDLSGGASWSTGPNGEIISHGGRPLNAADKVVVSYCEKILNTEIAKAHQSLQ